MSFLDDDTFFAKSAGKAWSQSVTADGTYRFEVRGDDYYSRSGTPTEQTDAFQGKNRSEIVTMQKLQEGRAFTFDFDFMVENGATNSADWLVLAQFHQTEDVSATGQVLDAAASPPLALQLRGERLEIVGRTDADPITTTSPENISMYLATDPIQRGRFYNIRFEMVFDDAVNGKGYLRVFLDGVQIVDYTGPLGYNDSIGAYAQFGVYREQADETFAAQFRNLSLTSSEAAPPINGTGAADLLEADKVGFLEGEVLNGYAGNDTLNGGFGADTMNGGKGDDSYVVNHVGDVVNERLRGVDEGGHDLVQSYISYTLGADIEDLMLWSDADINGTGNEGVNVIRGNDGKNILRGMGGHDTLLGDLGNDTLYGGAGNDDLFGGDGDDWLYGDAGDDHLYAQGGTNRMYGGEGNDLLEGWVGGRNTLAGGTGDDQYVIANTGATVIELVGEGVDTLRTSVSFDIGVGNHIEILNTTDADGTTAINIFGSDIANEIRGNNGRNHLMGRGGNDRIMAGGGDDSLDGNLGADSLYGEAGNDTLDGGDDDDLLYGGAGDDVVIGGAGNDTLDGGTGADTLRGGAGDDQYVVAGLGSVVQELAGEGNDTVRASVSLDVGAANSIEFLYTTSQTGTGAIDLAGDDTANEIRGNDGANGLVGRGGDDRIFGYGGDDSIYGGDGNDSLIGGGGDDVIYGGAGNDTLRGDAGADTLDGGAGDDSYYIDAAGMQVIEAAGGGIDVIRTSVSIFLAAGSEVEVVRVTDQAGTTAIDLQGSDTSNELRGNNGNNVLDGRGGADTMRGFGGDDIYYVDHAGDMVFDGVGEGNDTIYAAISMTLGSSLEIEVLRTTNDSGTAAINFTGNLFNNTLWGNAGANQLRGGDGDDTLIGLAGNDTIFGGAGSDTVVFAFASTAASATQSGTALLLQTDDGTDLIYGDVEFFQFSDRTLTFAEAAALRASFGEIILGSDKAENLAGTAASEVINAFGGNDWITPGAGSDTIDGGDGRDMVSFSNLAQTMARGLLQYRLDLDLGAGRATTSGGDIYILQNVERITGTVYADRIRGDAGDNELRGLGDYDWFVATTGKDTMDGGTGADMVSYAEWKSDLANADTSPLATNGRPPAASTATGVVVDLANTANNTNLAAGHTYVSIERITGSGRADVFYGDGNENDFRGLGDYDWFVGSGGGRDRYFGGDGVDTVTYYRSTSGVTASLSNGAKVAGVETGYGTGGDAARDLYFEIENLVGSNFKDVLHGSSGRNTLMGLDGDDFLFGYGGTDMLKGGLGNDVIDGGAGSDYAIFSGLRADYTLTKTSANTALVVGADGTDRLIDVEYFRFDDMDVNIWSL